MNTKHFETIEEAQLEGVTGGQFAPGPIRPPQPVIDLAKKGVEVAKKGIDWVKKNVDPKWLIQ